MTNKRPHIAFIGTPGFPLGFGAMQRLTLIAKGLLNNGCNVTIISYKGVHGPEHGFPAQGKFDGISYQYTSGTIHRSQGFFRRNWLKVVGKIKELAYLRHQRKSGKLTACMVSTMQIDELLVYRIWLKWLGVPLILDYVELNSAIASRTRKWKRINDYFFDRFAVRFSDGVTPISDFLIEQVKIYAPNKPFLKLPILCDFEKFDPTDPQAEETRITYCGAASYQPVIAFVLEAFGLLDLSTYQKKVHLELILGGGQTALQAVEKAISKNPNRAHIRLHPNVPHQLIPEYYARASALLIPLRPTIQDAARFPHKLGEYLASGRPIITTNFGEVKHYGFQDEETTLIAADYDPVSFSEKIQYVLNHPERARSIGLRGRTMGLENFDYKVLGHALKKFIEKIETTENYNAGS